MAKSDIMRKTKETEKENKTQQNQSQHKDSERAIVKEIQAESLIIWFGKSVNEHTKQTCIHTCYVIFSNNLCFCAH